MRYKKTVMLIIFIACLLSVSAVSAAENISDDAAFEVAPDSSDGGFGYSDSKILSADETILNGDNNYKSAIETDCVNEWNKLDFEVDFDSINIYEDEESLDYVSVHNLTDGKNAVLTLFIDDVKVKNQSFSIYEDCDEGYVGEIEFDASHLSEGIHNWKITYFDVANNINSSQTGLVKVYHVGEPDKEVLVTNDGLIADIDGEFVFVKQCTVGEDSEYKQSYTIYTFTANGTEYVAIRKFPVTFFSVYCYEVFDPDEYQSFEGIYYKAIDGNISEVIDGYEEIDGVYYKYVGRPYEYYNSGYGINYFVVNGTCYKSQYYHVYEAVEGVDYNVVDGVYYTSEGIKIYVYEYFDGAIVKDGYYMVDNNLYFHQMSATVGYNYVEFNGEFYRLVQTYAGEELKSYALIDGKLYSVKDYSLGGAVEIAGAKKVPVLTYAVGNDAQGKYVDISLKDNNGNPVKMVHMTLKINNKTFKFLINSFGQCRVFLYSNGDEDDEPEFDGEDGSAMIHTRNFEDGNYSVLIKFAGNSIYSAVSKNIKVEIANNIKEDSSAKNDTSAAGEVSPAPQVDSQAVLPAVKTTLTLKNVAVKKSAKKLVIQAVLKKGNVPLKKKWVIFRFNGKAYIAKTNNKGVAKITVKKNVLKKLKVGKKVKYQAIYGKVTASKIVKVKK